MALTKAIYSEPGVGGILLEQTNPAHVGVVGRLGSARGDAKGRRFTVPRAPSDGKEFEIAGRADHEELGRRRGPTA